MSQQPDPINLHLDKDPEVTGSRSDGLGPGGMPSVVPAPASAEPAQPLPMNSANPTNPVSTADAAYGAAPYGSPPQAPPPYGQPQQGNPYAQPQPGYPQPNAYPGVAGSPYPPVDVRAKSRLAAGLFGIFLGCFGVHRFYLGYTGIGIAMLLITVLSFGFLSIIPGIWGLVEGILYLTAKQGSYSADAKGRPLT